MTETHVTIHKMADELGDSDILLRVQNGDQHAFEELVLRYQGYVFAIVRRHVPADLVEELAHEVFVQAYKSLPTYKERSPFKNWLATIAVRQCYAHWKSKKARREVPLSVLTPEIKDWCSRVQGRSAREQFDAQQSRMIARDLLDWALGQLPAKDRMVLSLVYLEELSVQETATLLGWSKSNVKVRAHRARKKLSEILNPIVEKGER